MCLASIYWSGIKKVFYSADRHDAAIANFDDRFIYEELEKPHEEKSIIVEKMINELR